MLRELKTQDVFQICSHLENVLVKALMKIDIYRFEVYVKYLYSMSFGNRLLACRMYLDGFNILFFFINWEWLQGIIRFGILSHASFVAISLTCL